MIAEFRLKTFFNDAEARSARGSLSGSYAELATIEELLALQPGAADDYLRLSLNYTALNGGEELRSLIAGWIGEGGNIAADQVIVTNGSDDAIALLLLGWLQPGDHVIAHMPAYQPLVALAEWRGAALSAWDAEEARGWALSLERLEALIRPATRLIIVNFPHNPTGWSPDADFVRDLIAIAERHGIVILSDEVYAGLSLTAAASLPSLAALSSRVVSLGSLTKAFGMPGVRIGWLATRNAEVFAAARRFRMYFNSYATAPGEFLACLALRHADAILARNAAIARDNLDVLAAFLQSRPQHFAWQRPCWAARSASCAGSGRTTRPGWGASFCAWRAICWPPASNCSPGRGISASALGRAASRRRWQFAAFVDTLTE